MNCEQAYVDLVEACRELCKAHDIKLYEADGCELNGHHYLAREAKQRKITLALNEIRYQVGLDFRL